MLEESLLDALRAELPSASPESLKRTLVSHRFPFALAGRPLRTLSPGERTRAALIALSHRAPPVEVLVLDEPNVQPGPRGPTVGDASAPRVARRTLGRES